MVTDIDHALRIVAKMSKERYKTPGTPEDKASKIFFVTKNDKDYWEFGEYI